ncbi:MAG TPA: HNH endonuclease [Pyrinomonadaceae bacterium]|nr:HNH endonuclease [Pyrinomonadaceae bacterium]
MGFNRSSESGIWWSDFWKAYHDISMQAALDRGDWVETTPGHYMPLPMIGCGVVFTSNPIKAGSAGGPNAGGRFPKAVRDETLSGEPACVFCGEPATQADHAIPRARGGNPTPDNAQPACAHCNPSKGAGDFPKTPPTGYDRQAATLVAQVVVSWTN